MKHITEKQLNMVCQRLASIKLATNSLGMVFNMATDDLYFNYEQLTGVGEIFRMLSRETQRIELFLRYEEIKQEFADDKITEET